MLEIDKKGDSNKVFPRTEENKKFEKTFENINSGPLKRS